MILYQAAIAGIDEEMNEAARVDGASRMQIIWNITIPSILPTCTGYAESCKLPRRRDSASVFQNAFNKDSIQVLDLYVYNLAMGSERYSLSTAISILKTLISVVLLCVTNKASKLPSEAKDLFKGEAK